MHNPDEIDIDDDDDDDEEEDENEDGNSPKESKKQENIPIAQKTVPAKVFGGLKRKNESDSE